MAARVTIRKAGAAEPSPSESLVAEAVAEVVVQDAKGRQITLKKPNVLAQYRLVKVLGDSAANPTYVGMVLPLLFVAAIEGETVGFPQSEREVEALILRLDDAGLEAVMTGVRDNWGSPNIEEQQDHIKK